MTYSDEQKLIETRVRDALGALTRGDTAPWAEMLANDGVREFPYAPEGSTRRIEGKAEIADYLKPYPEMLDLHRIGRIVWRHDGNAAVAEFEVEGAALPTGKPYNQRYISVIEHRDGLITRYVDYWNPQIVADALGGMYE